MRSTFAAGLAGFCLIAPAAAEQFPRALVGKSIILEWTDNRTMKDNYGNFYYPTLSFSIQIYIGLQGHVFSTFHRVNQNRPSHVQDSSEVGGPAGNVLHWRFQNGSLSAVQLYRQGAREIAVRFQDSFQKCTLDVRLGKAPGTTAILMNGLVSSREYELVDLKITSARCNVKRGNIFETDGQMTDR
jgi:hypothetical protein